MNLNQLRYVKAVADTGSFTQAAARCFVTQPTLSNGLAQLEQELGEKLFTRTTRTVSLTPFGEHILPFIEKVLHAQAELVQEYRHYVYPERQVIRVGVSPLIQTGRFAEMLSSFRQAHSSSEVIFTEQNMSDLFRMLDDDMIDFVFGVSDESHKLSRTQAFLYEEPLFYIPRAGDIEESRLSVTIDDMAGKTIVMVPDGCGLARATRAVFRSQRRKFQEYPGKAMSYQVLEEWASLGLGAAILPESKLVTGKIRALPIVDKSGTPLMLSFEGIWKEGMKSPSLVVFAEYLAGFATHHRL